MRRTKKTLLSNYKYGNISENRISWNGNLPERRASDSFAGGLLASKLGPVQQAQ